jgi:hypothetical protein
VGENRSLLFGILDLSGFPAKAWVFMDMVVAVVVMLRKEGL